MAIRGLSHLTLAVSNIDRSVRFYRDVLGLDVAAQWETGAYLQAGSLWLCLSVDENAAQQTRSDYTHIAFDVEPQEFDELAMRLRTRAHVWKENRSEGPSLYILDPDSHKLEIHAGDLASRLAHYRAHPPKGYSGAECSA